MGFSLVALAFGAALWGLATKAMGILALEGVWGTS